MLSQLSINSISELSAYSRPPIVCEMILQGIGVLLEPSKKKFQWADAKKMMGNRSQFIQALRNFDKDSVTDDQLIRLTEILSRDECSIQCVTNVSMACRQLCIWLRIIAQHAILHRQSTEQQT